MSSANRPQTVPAGRTEDLLREKNFDVRLQSIRGLAAAVVAFHHSFNLFPFPAFSARILRAVEGVFSAQSAVLTFFVLSGYVLGLSLTKSGKVDLTGYAHFMVKRFCRILLPLAAAVVLLSLIVAGLVWSVTGRTFVSYDAWPPTSLMHTSYFRPFNLSVLMENVFLLEHDLDPVTWTITIEVIGSLLIPIFYVLNRSLYPRLALLFGLILLSVLSRDNGTSCLHYLYIFELGLLIPFWGKAVFRFLERTRLLAPALVMGAALCAVNSHLGHNFYILSFVLSFLLGFVIFRDHGLLHFLDLRPIIWLGKISYSFYLVHWPILWLSAWLLGLYALSFTTLYPVLSSVLVLLVSVPLAALLADGLYRVVELPSIRLGKRLIGSRSR